MRPAFMLATLLTAATAEAKDPCDKGKLVTDPMSGATSLQFRIAPGGTSTAGFWATSLVVLLDGSTAKVTLAMQRTGVALANDTIAPGAHLTWRFDDDRRLELTSKEAVAPLILYGTTSQWTLSAPLAAAKVGPFVGHLPVAMSATTHLGDQAWALSKGAQSALAGALACVASKAPAAP